MAVTKPFTVKGITVVSPKGKANWCKVKEPERTFNAKGTYATEVICDPSEPAVELFVNKLRELRDSAFVESKESLKPAVAAKLNKKEVFTEVLDDEGNDTGLIKFKFKLDNVDDKERGKNKVNVVDAGRKPIKDIPLVGNGSIIRCEAYANPYYMANGNVIGISLMWKSMQIIELVEYAGGSTGFDVEDGYTAEDTVVEDESPYKDDGEDY